ncbi:MAG: peptidoglycan DD-metalloendopeptidase family protein [Hamadaea sp.]|nr:peptidoglycan DD-metalloendopeptidase family protein [Hamadaea sp.]
MGDSAEKAGKKGAGFGKGIGGGLKIAAVGLAGIAAASAAGLGAFVKDAAESAKIGRLTEAVVKSTGGAAKITAAQVGDLATAISNKTGADDEAIQSGANMLLTFTNVRNEVGKGNDIFNRATQTVTDMSAALGQDTKSSAIQLGKALNDPVKGVTALQKVGVSFTEQQKAQIKTLVKSGDTLGAQKIILNELGKEFGGAAAAASDPMSRLGVIAGNLGEKVGGALLPYIGQFADWVSNKAIPAVSRFVDWLGPKLGPVVDGVKKLIGDVVTKVQAFIVEFQKGEGAGGKFRDVLSTVGGVIQNVTKWVSENQTIVKALVAAVLGGVAAFQVITAIVKVYTAVQAVLNTVMAANPIGIIIVAVAALAAGLIYAYKNSETFRQIVDTAFHAIADVGRWLWNKVLGPVIRFLIDGFSTVADWIGNMLEALSHVPGFGWAKDAADKLHGAAAKAKEFGQNIKDIPDPEIDTSKADAEMAAFYKKWSGRSVAINANVHSDVGNYRGGGSGGGGSVDRPVPGPIGTGWNGYPGHKGLDFPVPVGTPVRAAMSGRVVRAGWDPGGFGNHLRTVDDDGNMTIYGHLSRLVAHVGQRLSRGALAAFTGNTGHSTGAHLHLERRHPPFGPGNAWNFTSSLRPFVADAGVTLAPGINVLDNKLGKPEPLARTDQPGGRMHPDDLAEMKRALFEGARAGTAAGFGHQVLEASFGPRYT